MSCNQTPPFPRRGVLDTLLREPAARGSEPTSRVGLGFGRAQ